MPEIIQAGISLLSSGDAGGSILSPDRNMLFTMIAQWFNLALLTAFLIYVLYKPVKKFMHDRSERIRNEIQQAHTNNMESMELKQEYENILKKIDNEREEILQQAHRLAIEKSDSILLMAKQDANNLITKARSEIAKESEKAAEEMKRQIVELSVAIASRLITTSIDKTAQEKYVDEALAKWGENAE